MHFCCLFLTSIYQFHDTIYSPFPLTSVCASKPAGSTQCAKISNYSTLPRNTAAHPKTTSINYVLVYSHHRVPKLITRKQGLNNVFTHFIGEYVVPPSTVDKGKENVFLRLYSCILRIW